MERLISWVEIPAEDFDRADEFYNTILNLNLKTEFSGKEKKAFLLTGEGLIFSIPGFKPSKIETTGFDVRSTCVIPL